MSHRVPALAFLACLLAGGAASAATKVLENIPLKWSPTSTLAEMGPVDFDTPALAVKIHVEPFVDTRRNPALIAQNTEKPDKPRSGVIVGDAERFGRSYRADNYYEVFSDTLLRAAHNLLANPGFHDALDKR